MRRCAGVCLLWLWPAAASAEATTTRSTPPTPTDAQRSEEASVKVPASLDATKSGEPSATDSGKTNRLAFLLFVDTHYAYTSAESGTPVAAHRAFEANAGDFTTHNGFNLSWLGIDASYDGGEIGATSSLRFGSAVPVFYSGNGSALGIENLTQAYATWRPADRLELDFGKFSSIYGAEVAESWKNPTYTRGALYSLMQPLWHTGLRASYAFNDAFSATGLVVNGANSVIDDNDTPSLGLQLDYSKGDLFSLTLGYFGALRPSTDQSPFNDFFDLVASLSIEHLSLVLNGDLNVSPKSSIDRNADGRILRVVDNPVFWGLSLSAGYQFSPAFGLALRGELLDDAKNRLYAFEHSKDVKLTTVTGTIDVKPVKGSDNFIVRWDNRGEFANRDVFFDKDARATASYFESVVGVVVKSDE